MQAFVYSGLFATPERVARIAEDEDVNVVALSLLNGAHGTLFPRVVKEMKKKGIKNVLVVGGGVIPDVDKKALKKAGISEVFGHLIWLCNSCNSLWRCKQT